MASAVRNSCASGYRPFEMQQNAEVIDTLALDFGPYETVNRWKSMPGCDEFVGARRSKHTMVAWNNALYIFGGDNGKRMLNDMLRFDVKDCSWSRAVTKGTPPAPRYHHSAVVFNNSIYLFGGFTGDLFSNSNLQNKNDLFEYRFHTGQWILRSVEGRALPPARSAHGAVIYKNSLWIFAGYDGHKRLDDMWTICLTDAHPHWQEVQQFGDRPPTSCNFPAAVARDSMFVFSGQSGANVTNDMFQFDFRDHKWTRIPAAHLLRGSAAPPQRRYGHTMVPFGRYLYVFGGGMADNTFPPDLFRFDLDDMTWQIVQSTPDSQIPSGRLYHDADVIDGAMYIFGGTGDNQARSNELYRFQLTSYPRCTLRDDFGRLLNSRQFCDMAFIVGQEKAEFPVHAAFVAARSSWIKRKILQARDSKQSIGRDQPEQEQPLVKIELPDAEPQSFRITLRYMYTDNIYPLIKDCQGPEVISLMMDVYGLAVKLEVGSLEQLCVQYIGSSITQENVLVALERADKLRLKPLKDFCLKFIVRDTNYNNIIMSKVFEGVSRNLMVEIIRRRQAPSVPEAVSYAFTDSQSRQPAHPERTLQQDMKKFLTSSTGQEFQDLTLVVDGAPVRAHKAVLAARCSYFEAMFRSFMPDDNTVKITIGETIPSKQAFDSLLRYIYFGDTSMPPEDSLYLLPAPYFFGFTNNRLQAFSKENLELNVSFENVFEILEAAHKIGASDMMKHALKLIVRHFPKVAEFPQLRRLSRELLLDILDAIADYMKNSTSLEENS